MTRARAIALLLLLLGASGCSWIVGVSKDVVEVDASDGGDEADAPAE